MSAPEFVVRCLQPDEWRLLKALRLEALACDSQSYWETEEQSLARDDDFWMTFARELTPPQRSRMFIVEHAPRVAVFVFGVRKDSDEYRIGGLWVDPVHRRKGLGSVLVQQVVTWARADSPSAVVQLWCHTGPALLFYKKTAFILWAGSGLTNLTAGRSSRWNGATPDGYQMVCAERSGMFTACLMMDGQGTLERPGCWTAR